MPYLIINIGLNGANYKDFNHSPFLTFIYITYTILTEIIIIIFMD